MGEQVFGRYVNDACVKRGKELLKEAKEVHKKKAEDGKKDIYQSAKEGATYLRNKARGKIMIGTGVAYCCFECIYHRVNCSECRVCQNGSSFEPTKKEVANVS